MPGLPVLFDVRVAGAQPQAVHRLPGGSPLDVHVDLVFVRQRSLLALIDPVPAANVQRVDRQPLRAQPREIVGRVGQERLLTRAIEALHHGAGIAWGAAPRLLDIGAAADSRIGEREDRSRVARLGLDAELVGAEAVALEEVAAHAALVRVLRREQHTHVVRQRPHVLRLGIADVDDVLRVVINRADRRFAVGEEGAQHADAAVDRGARLPRHRDEHVGGTLLDLGHITAPIPERRSAVLASDGPLQAVSLERVGRYAVVVPVRVGRVVGLAIEVQELPLEELHAGIELAENGVTALPVLKQRRAVAIGGGIERLRDVEGGADG